MQLNPTVAASEPSFQSALSHTELVKCQSGFGYFSYTYKEGQGVKVYTFGLVVLSCFPSSRKFSGSAVFTHGLAWGTLNPLYIRHVRITLPKPLSLFFCICHSFQFCPSVCLPFYLSPSRSTCSALVSESLKSTAETFLWHTQQKLLDWQDEAKLTQKLCMQCM